MIPARNEERSIASCLRSVLAQDHRHLEVLVVDGASSDRTREIVRELASTDGRVVLVETPYRNTQKSLNRAVELARGRWFVRVDAHSTVPPSYVRRSVERLNEARWGGVGGRKDAVGQTPAGRAIAVALGSRFGVGNSLYHHGTAEQTVDHIPFGGYPTELLRQLGGWNEDLVANEDYELDLRIREEGYELLFDPTLAISWECRDSMRALYSQYRRYGRGKAGVARLHPRSMRPRHYLPPAAVAGWFVVGAVRRRDLVVASLAPYFAAVLVASALSARKADGGLPIRARIPLAFATMHVAWGLGFWEGLTLDVLKSPRTPERGSRGHARAARA